MLYADDDFLNGRLMQILLRHAGVECDLAHDGRLAFRMYQSARYDAVILDTYLPGLNGDDVARRIRRTDGSVPLVAITSDEEARDRLMNAGFDRIFLKPLRGRKCLDYLLRIL